MQDPPPVNEQPMDNLPPAKNEAENLQPDVPDPALLPKHIDGFPNRIDDIWIYTDDIPFTSDGGNNDDDSQRVGGDLYSGIGGLTRRIFTSIRPFVWVKNCSKEEIVVVVSDYRPRHIFTGLNLSGSATGGGIGINFTTYTRLSMSKRIPAKLDSSDGQTRSFSIPWDQGYACVSIFLGPKKEFVVIENDHVPLGGLAVFDGSQCEVFDHEGRAWGAHPFACDVCKKTYSRADHLVRHYRTHTKEKPFTCSLCGKSFARRDLLIRHSSLHGGEEQRREILGGNNKQRTRVACLACAAAKLRCSETRPCERCTLRGITCDKPTSSPNIEEHDSSPELSGANARLLVETSNHEAYKDQPEQQHSVFGDPHIEPTALQPGQSSGSDVFDSHVAQPVHMSQIPGEMAVHSGTNTFMYNQASDSFFGLEGQFDDILMGTFLNDIVNAQYSDHQFPSNSTDMFPDVLHVGFSEHDIYPSSIFGHMPASTTALHTDVTGNSNHFTRTHTGIETPAVRKQVHAGEQAFRESMWLWDPAMEDSSLSDQIHLTLPGNGSIEDNQTGRIDSESQISAVNRDKLLLMILGTCEPRVQRQVVASFPSTHFLSSLLVDFKIRHHHQISPWIHFASLDLENECEEFVAAMICAGAVDSKRPEVRKLGMALQEAARLAIAKRFEEDNRMLRDLRTMQAFLLVLNVGLNSGSRRKVEIAESYTLNLITMLRRGGRFRDKWKGRPEPNIEDQNQDLQARWKRWVEEESFKRLVYHVLFQDVQTSAALFRQPLTSYSEINLPMPCAPHLWEAKSAELWWQEILSRQHHPKTPQVTLPQCLQNPRLLDFHKTQIDVQMSLRIMVANFWLRVWQSIQMRPFSTPEDTNSRLALVNPPHQQLVTAAEDLTVRFSQGSISMHPSVRLMLEIGRMHLYVSLEDIQQLAGNEGEERARKAASRLRTWIMLPEARHALFHAGQVARATAECPSSYVRGVHAVMVYHASLTMWAYALLATSQNTSHVGHTIRNHDFDDDEEQPTVWLDGEEIPELRRFILLGHGTPCIRNYSSGSFGGRSNELNRVPLTDAANVMMSIVGLLSNRNESEHYCIPIASYLGGLMHTLAKASAAMKLSR